MKDTSKQFLEEFFSSSKRIKIKGDPVKWFKKRLDEQYEEEYGLLISKWKRARRLLK